MYIKRNEMKRKQPRYMYNSVFLTCFVHVLKGLPEERIVLCTSHYDQSKRYKDTQQHILYANTIELSSREITTIYIIYMVFTIYNGTVLALIFNYIVHVNSEMDLSLNICLCILLINSYLCQ